MECIKTLLCHRMCGKCWYCWRTRGLRAVYTHYLNLCWQKYKAGFSRFKLGWVSNLNTCWVVAEMFPDYRVPKCQEPKSLRLIPSQIRLLIIWSETELEMYRSINWWLESDSFQLDWSWLVPRSVKLTWHNGSSHVDSSADHCQWYGVTNKNKA